METDTKELEKWRRLIVDGDWAVRQLWKAYAGKELDATPLTIQAFMAWLIRHDFPNFIDWEDESSRKKRTS